MIEDAKVILFGNYKGGVGKTTTAYYVANVLSKKDEILSVEELHDIDKGYKSDNIEKLVESLSIMKDEQPKKGFGKKVLLIDLDPQGSLSELYKKKFEKNNKKDITKGNKSINYLIDYCINAIENDFFIEEYKNLENGCNENLKSTIVSSILKDENGNNNGIDILISDPKYRSYLGLDFLSMLMKPKLEYLLIVKLIIECVKSSYDYIIFDTPPSNNFLVQSAILASDYYIIPSIPDEISSNGIVHFMDVVKRTYSNNLCFGINASFVDSFSSTNIIFRKYFSKQIQFLGVVLCAGKGVVNYKSLIEQINNRISDAINKNNLDENVFTINELEQRAVEDFSIEVKDEEKNLKENLKLPILKPSIRHFKGIAEKLDNIDAVGRSQDLMYEVLTNNILARIYEFEN